MGYFQPLVIYRDPDEERSNSILRYIGNRVNSSNKNFLCAVVGCLSGDTKVYGQYKTIEELYKSGKKEINTYSLNKYKKGLGTYYPIKSKSTITYTGKKEVYEIELENGKKVLATLDHSFFKKDKYSFKESDLRDLKVGDEIRDFPKEYIKNFYNKANNRQKKKTKENHNIWKRCKNCHSLIYIKNKSGMYSQKYCNYCSSNLGTNYLPYKNHDDIWYEWEDNILRNFYKDKDKDFILELLPSRSWSAILHRSNILKIKRDDKFSQKNNWTSKNNPMKIQHIKEKTLRKVFKILSNRKRMTSIEKKVSDILIKNNIDFKFNNSVKTKSTIRFPDFIIGTLIIECDGHYWHKDRKEQDTKRQKELENCGFKVIRFSENQINNNILEVEKCILQELNL